MRLGWSVLCRGYEEHDDGSMTLKNVFADSVLNVSPLDSPPVQVALRPTVVLVAYWFAESDSDRKRYPAILRVLAPGDNQILDEWSFAIDFLLSSNSVTVFAFTDMMFVGDGLYEFHIEVPEFGEWTIMSRSALYINEERI